MLGLSGGVDSAVAARLLQDQGYLVEGLYLDVGNPDAQRDAIQTAQWLDIGLRIDDVRFQLEQCVCEPFQQAYLQGRTPNPCILCNPAMKFERLCAYADEIGAKYIATGHYVRTRDGMLFKGHPANDQSYMLCRLKRGQAERFLAPLGEYEKSQVRAMADQMGIPVAKKPDSMEICFIQDGDYVAWLSKRCALPGPGRILRNGEVIGEHQGIFRWTVGQRLPGLYDERKLYVAAIDAKENTLIAALWEELV